MTNFAKMYSKRNKLTPHLDAWFERATFPDSIPFNIHLNKESDSAFHPSSDAMACLAHMYYLRTGDLDREEFSGTTHKIFHVGHIYHAWIQHILAQELGFSSWEDIETEYRLGSDGESLSIDVDWRTDSEIARLVSNGGWWARGFTDVAHCHIPKHGDYLIDIKTVNSYYFKLDRLPEHVMAKYEVQCQLYMDWHKQENALLLCVQKDSPHAFKEFEFKRDPSIAAAVYERWDVLAEALVSGMPPDCDCPNPKSCPAYALQYALQENVKMA